MVKALKSYFVDTQHRAKAQDLTQNEKENFISFAISDADVNTLESMLNESQ